MILTVAAIYMNVKLIPLWGMNGAALASLISYIVYYLLLLIFVKVKVKVNPLSMRELYTFSIIVTLFVMDYLFQNHISKYLFSLFRIELLGQMLDSVIRTLLFSMLGIVTIYKLKISKQVNDIIDNVLTFLKLTK